MEIKGIIREIEISRVLNQPLDGDALVIQTFFDELFNNLEIDTLDEYPDSIFFIKNGHDIYMEQDYKNERLYCSYNKIWSFFEENLSLNYQGISDLIKVMVEQQLKEKVFTPNVRSYYKDSKVEQQLKEKVFTPNDMLGKYEKLVEQQLKEKVFTPIYYPRRNFGWVEQQLKEKVFTPCTSSSACKLSVEQQLKEKVFTPFKTRMKTWITVEQQLKEKVFTPDLNILKIV